MPLDLTTLRHAIDVTPIRFANLREYYSADPRRHPSRGWPPSEWDLGTFWRRDGSRCARVTWVPPTRELIAVMQGSPGTGDLRSIGSASEDNPLLIGNPEARDPAAEGPVEVLGQIATAWQAEALLWWRQDDPWPTLEDVRRRVAEAPTTPEETRRFMRRWRAAVSRDEAELDDQRRNSYEMVELALLPPDGVEPVPPLGRRPCGCYYCRGSWRRIAELSVDILAQGIDPLDGDAIAAASARRLRTKRDQVWLKSLFSDPIIVAPGEEAFTNGRHRTHAMRIDGVERAVVYTKAGERRRRKGTARADGQIRPNSS